MLLGLVFVIVPLAIAVVGCGNIGGSTDVSESDPAWSPDGSRLAYVRLSTSWDSSGQDLLSCTSSVWIRNIDGSAAHKLVDGQHPSWSPNGKRIAYLSFKTTGQGSFTQAAIDVVNADGSQRRQLLPAAADDGSQCSYSDDLPVGNPEWSPDGALIAYFDHSRICLIRPDGSHRRCLQTPRAIEPHWSADGTQIVFGVPIDQKSTQSTLRLYVINRDGRDLRGLRTCCDVGQYFGPVWSPRANLIVFGDDGSNCLLAPATGSLYALNTGDIIGSLTWSPDGKRIAYATGWGNLPRIHLLNVKPLVMTSRLRSLNPNC